MSSISAGTTASTTLVHSGDTTGSLVFKTNDTGSGGTTAVTIDTSQNVGVGTTSPIYKLNVKQPNNTSIGSLLGVTSSTHDSTLALGYRSDIGAMIVSATYASTGSYQPLYFRTSDTNQMVIDTSGNVLIGQTAQSGSEAFGITRPSNTATYIHMIKAAQVEATWGFKSSTDSNMYIGSGSANVGTYGVYLTNTGNSWQVVSDENTKNIIEPIQNAVEKVNTLRAVIGSYKNDPNNTRKSFLIAQDVQAVLPEAVSIADQETQTLGMSYSDVIPLLVAAIKELKAQNDALTARIVALEAK